jgi:2-haloacid dehalogenase
VEASRDEIMEFMVAWQSLSPFPEVVAGLERLKTRFKLVALSNGEPDFLAHLVKNRIKWDFDDVISVQVVGAFKPHPGVYRRAAHILGLEIGECLMVSANSFDVMGARACGMRGAFVNRYALPYEDSPHVPDVTVTNFTELADALLA